MIDENAVTHATARYLERQGFKVVQELDATERGVDIVANHSQTGRTLLIESKGGTSTRVGSARYGRPYNQSQVFDRVAKGFYTAAVLHAGRDDPATQSVALAMPNTEHFRRYASDVLQVASKVGITFFMVNQDRSVVEL